MSFASDSAACLWAGKDLWGPKGDGFVKTRPGDFRLTAMKIMCPTNCREKTKDKMPVTGPSIGENDPNAPYKYSLDSSICGSAIHAGLISDIEGGNVIYHLSQEVEGFISTEQNGMKSNSGDKSEATVYIKAGPDTIVMGCTEPADNQLKVKANARYGIECPPGCFTEHGKMAHDIWGNPLFGYTKDSAVCLAAMHSDLLADNESN